jgi:hypothetical protein
MAISDWAEWRGTISVGQVRVPVAADAGLPGARGAVELAVAACADAGAWPRPPAHRLRWLRPRAGGERAYALFAEALEHTRLVALLRADGSDAPVALWALAGSLGTAEAPALEATPPDALPSDEEVALAGTLLRALPRRLPVAPIGARGEEVPALPAPSVGEVITLDVLRRRRATALGQSPPGGRAPRSSGPPTGPRRPGAIG